MTEWTQPNTLPPALDALGERAKEAIFRALRARGVSPSELTEVRVRAARPLSLTLDRQNLVLDLSFSAEEIGETVRRLCRGSVYAYEDTIREGYLPLPGGVRCGVYGAAYSEGERILSLRSFSGLVFRLPRRIRGKAAFPASLFLQNRRGMLLFSPPGVGKTTVLRELAERLSTGERPLRVAVIDSRGELDDGTLSPSALIDLLSGYPRGKGISVAVRTLSPDLIVTDEIGTPEEAESLLLSARCGVPVVATAHAASFEELERSALLSPLLSAGVFPDLVRVTREPGEADFTFETGEGAVLCRS